MLLGADGHRRGGRLLLRTLEDGTLSRAAAAAAAATTTAVAVGLWRWRRTRVGGGLRQRLRGGRQMRWT